MGIIINSITIVGLTSMAVVVTASVILLKLIKDSIEQGHQRQRKNDDK